MSDVPGRDRATGDDVERPAAPDEPDATSGRGAPGERPELGDDVPAGLGVGGLGELLESAQQALSAQAEAAAQVVEGRAGGGVVRVEMTGAGDVTSVRLAPEVVDPDDVEMLEDLIVAALRDAATQVAGLQRKALGAFGGLDAGGLGDLVGGAQGEARGREVPPAEEGRPAGDVSRGGDVRPADDDLPRPGDPGTGGS